MTATLLVRGAHIHTLAPEVPQLSSLAIRGDRVLEVSPDPHGLAELAGAGTLPVDLDGMCLLPGFGDSHVHQIEACQDLDTVDLAAARSINDVVDLLRAEAERTPAGRWIVARRGWHEFRLAERRLPTPQDLDRATTAHPVMVRRGSHLAVLNHAGLHRAGDRAKRDDHGQPMGIVRRAEIIRSLAADPASTGIDAQADALARVCSLHAGRGLVGVRDAGITEDDLAVYRRLEDRGELTIRTDAMMRIPLDLDRDAKLALVDDLGPPPPVRSNFLRVEGVKLYADGRVEDAAMRDPYLGRDHDRGVLYLDADEVEAVAGRAVSMGWRVGIHTVGDRALDAVLDGYQRISLADPGLPKGWLTVEHALLANTAQRRRVAELGVGVTVQHPLLDGYAGPMIEIWGPERAAAASPLRGWLDAGALVAAGSDGHVTPFDPLRSISGLATRHTLDAGVLGGDQRISLEMALRLYSVEAHWLTGWRTPKVGFSPGAFADFVAFPSCVLSAPPDALVGGLEPVLTVTGGQATYEPAARWPHRN